MLGSKKRISRRLFESLIKSPNGKPFFANSTHFSLRAVSSPTSSSHIAVSVSKKVAKRAVDRNRIRRRAYSVLRTIEPQLESNLYLFTAKSGAGKIKGEALAEELKRLTLKFLV